MSTFGIKSLSSYFLSHEIKKQEILDEIISGLKTQEECKQLENIFTDLANHARRRAIELKASSNDRGHEIETELYKALDAYEEVLSKKNNRTTVASRTRQMIERYGIIEAAERAVNRPNDAPGYKLLSEMGMSDLTFESIMIRHPGTFSNEAVERAKNRIEELKNDLWSSTESAGNTEY